MSIPDPTEGHARRSLRIRTRRTARHLGRLYTLVDGVRALSRPHVVLIIDPGRPGSISPVRPV